MIIIIIIIIIIVINYTYNNLIIRLKGQVSFTQIRENTGIENLVKRRKDLRFKYYLNAIDKDLTVPDFGGFKKCHNTRQ